MVRFTIIKDDIYEVHGVERIVDIRDQMIKNLMEETLDTIDSVALVALKEDILLALLVKEYVRSTETKRIVKDTKVTLEVKSQGIEYLVIANLKGKLVYDQA